MGEHKGAITLMLVVLLILGLLVAFTTGIINPLLHTVGDKFNELVDTAFNSNTKWQ
ncbi:hypothetical protein [Heyndrickxia ginsengihumi]|uniref:hypothetical protein n=1 Tax=Heyndrickxia ginsengihumi TaxID=363870 RepID=UPI0004BAAE85|nr:hypothetical protein [Heyndrickxia ginsengihumi]